MKKYYLFGSTGIAINIILISTALAFTSCHKTVNSNQTTDSSKIVLPIVFELKHSLPNSLKESSGLCYTDGNLWTFGDSGNPNEIYKIDSSTGAVSQTVIVENFPNIDWEDITADSNYIYVGDFGNNSGSRTDLKILRIKKSDLASNSLYLNVQADAINFSYSDQTDFEVNENTNFDCEALISIKDNLYIFTKDGGDLQTRCYKLPKIPGSYAISPISNFNTMGKITAVAFNPATNEVALLGYMNKKLNSFILFLNGYDNDQFFSGRATRLNIGNSMHDWQTEGLDYVETNRLFMSCESSTSTEASLYFVLKN